MIAFIFQGMTTILAAPLSCPAELAFLLTLAPFSLVIYFHLNSYEKDHSNQYRNLAGLIELDFTEASWEWIG